MLSSQAPQSNGKNYCVIVRAINGHSTNGPTYSDERMRGLDLPNPSVQKPPLPVRNMLPNWKKEWKMLQHHNR